MNLLEKIRYKIGDVIRVVQLKGIDMEWFGDKKNLSLQEANDRLAEDLNRGEPLSVIRLGITELQWLCCFEGEAPLPESFYYIWFDGLFRKPGEKQKFLTLLKEGYQQADYIGCWYFSREEGALLKRYASQAEYASARFVEPYYINDHPWTLALSGKKVLVVSPFTETIRRQYERKNLIYPDGLLPDFNLITMKSIWYDEPDNSEFDSWFNALDAMKKKVMSMDFDVALLGCGPFGTPLTTYIKSMGKQAIYIGGALQILFGIKGKRWDASPEIRRLYNETWIYPSEEKPRRASVLDDSCYWGK